jgi:dihydrofolate reductase
MIRCIAALDNKNGIADEHGIPWRGKLPTDVAYYRTKITEGGDDILMGYVLYQELSHAYPGQNNYVASRNHTEPLRPGFTPVQDAHKFLETTTTDVWNIGGAALFASTIDLADELYLTRIEADFQCTKFFPGFGDDFELIDRGPDQTENGLTFHFEIWKRK